MNRDYKFLLFYILANSFTLAMLVMLQISEWPIFILWLILMHSGIIALALTKRHFKDLDIKKYFKRVYLSFALFIPVLIYKLIFAIIGQEENEVVVRTTVIVAISICVIIMVLNVVSFIFHNLKRTSH